MKKGSLLYSQRVAFLYVIDIIAILACRRNTYKVYAFTVNDPDDLEAGRTMGLDGFYTDTAAP